MAKKDIEARGSVSASTAKPCIAVCSDRAIIRAGLISILRNASYPVVSLESTPKKTIAGRPELFVIDIGDSLLPPEGWVPPFIAEMKTPKLAFCLFADTYRIKACIASGFKGVIHGDSSREAMLKAIHQLLNGQLYIEPHIAAKLVEAWRMSGGGRPFKNAPSNALTNRELDIYHLIGMGNSNLQIAQALGLSVRTIETHKGNIKKKMGLKSATELAVRAVRDATRK